MNKLRNPSELSQSDEYQKFRSQIPLKKIVVDDKTSKVWSIYDAGPKDVKCPLILLPPVCGTADIFFLQMMELCPKGYRIISVSYPNYWNLREFVSGFLKLLDHLNLDKVHLFGTSIGGFLAQKFAESITQCQRVQSIILCNSFSDTSIFNYTESASMFWMIPAVVLRKIVYGNTQAFLSRVDSRIADSIVFMNEKIETLTQPELASRLTLNCSNSYIEPQKLRGISITLMDVFDRCALSLKAREELYKMYPEAKRAHLKTGGNFPYLSRSEEVNMHILVHLRQFLGTKYSASNHQVPQSKENIFEVPRSPQPASEVFET